MFEERDGGTASRSGGTCSQMSRTPEERLGEEGRSGALSMTISTRNSCIEETNGWAMSGKTSQTTWQRIEAKYLVAPELAAHIRSYCEACLEIDPYSARRPNRGYPIHSIYLDSAESDLLRGTIERQPNRVKLRVRTYREFSGSNGSPVAYFEIKRKSFGVVQKSRAKLPRAEAESLLWNGDAHVPGSANGDGAGTSILGDFLGLRAQIGARPTIGVFYTREAFESGTGDRVRITLDRNLHYGLLDYSNGQPRETWWPVHLRAVILEVKFTNTFPFWVRDIVRRSELTRRGVCKFLMCSQAARGVDLNLSAIRSL
jgi:hypothetical protein